MPFLRTPKKLSIFVTFAALVVLVGTMQLRADVTGSIQGYVRDRSGAVIPNATLTANNLSCGYEVCGVTGDAKQYLFHGPGTINTDAGVGKDTKITERTSLNFRIEFFNVFNHANFLSNSVIGDANSSQFGQVTITAAGRIGQISGKFIF
jgi:hypothetical protein